MGGAGYAYSHLQSQGRRYLSWRDLTAELGYVRWPVQVVSVIKSRDKFARILADTIPRGTPNPPAVDYRHREALLIALGPRSSSGYRLKIVHIMRRGRRILVVLREVTPRLGGPQRAGLVFPYRLLTIPLTDTSVRFHLLHRL